MDNAMDTLLIFYIHQERIPSFFYGSIIHWIWLRTRSNVAKNLLHQFETFLVWEQKVVFF